MPQKFKDYKLKFKSFIKECWRVLLVTKRPDKEEFSMVVKVTGIGILIIGIVGAIIAIISVLAGI